MSDYADESAFSLVGKAEGSRTFTLVRYISWPGLFLTALWFGLNTGPWVLRRAPESIYQALHTGRALIPFAVLPMAVWYLVLHPAQSDSRRVPNPLRLWIVYGVIGLAASVMMSPSPFDAAYWGIAYLASMATIAAYLRKGYPIQRSIQANYISWLINTIFLLTMLILARDAVFADPVSGHGSIRYMRSVIDMPMSRSSGLARFAAVPGVIAFVYMIKGGGLTKPIGGAVFLAASWMIYYMQSRGAMVGFMWALLFCSFLMGKRGRLLLFVVIVLGVMIFFSEGAPQQLWMRLTRGDTAADDLLGFGGRSKTWRAAWAVFWESPLFGWGYQADRMLIKDAVSNVHNTYFYALLTAGIFGAAFFVAGFIKIWTQLIAVARSGIAKAMGHEMFFVQVCGVISFFTVRSVTEVSGPLFAVDLLVMLPAILYIGVMHRSLQEHRNRQAKGELSNV